MVSLANTLAEPRPEQQAALVAQRYQLMERLGHGGVGAVFRVRDTSTGRELALKRLLEGKGDRVKALFEFEYYTLAGLRSPHIVEVYDYGNDATGPYYTMELLEGADLSKAEPTPWPEACRLISGVADGLALLHARRLVHRDVSLRNLWRTPQGSVKLIDFGALAPFGQPDVVVGTPPFVAPEAFYGQALDQRTDLYALGAALYWLVTGSHAFAAKHLRDLPNHWALGAVPPSQRIAALKRPDLPELPGELESLIELLLSPDPRARPSTAGDLTDRLRTIAGIETRSAVVPAERGLPQPLFVGRSREQRYFHRLAGGRQLDLHRSEKRASLSFSPRTVLPTG